jgi:hypothetical protein
MAIENPAVRRDTTTETVHVVDRDRRELLAALTVVAGGSAVSLLSAAAQAQPDNAPLPCRAVTGRDVSGKSIFKSFDVTPQAVTFKSRPGLAFYELYSTDGVPRITE